MSGRGPSLYHPPPREGEVSEDGEGTSEPSWPLSRAFGRCRDYQTQDLNRFQALEPEMPDTVDYVLASDITWRMVRVGLEDSLTDTLVGGAGWQSLGLATARV